MKKLGERLLPDLRGVFVALFPPPHAFFPPVRGSLAAGGGREARVKGVGRSPCGRQSGALEVEGLIAGGPVGEALALGDDEVSAPASLERPLPCDGRGLVGRQGGSVFILPDAFPLDDSGVDRLVLELDPRRGDPSCLAFAGKDQVNLRLRSFLLFLGRCSRRCPPWSA